jgi:hypothetical protein
MRPGGDLSDEIYKLGRYPIRTIRDAKAICSALERIRPADTGKETTSIFSPLNTLLGSFQDVVSERAFLILLNNGLPQLLRIFDEAISLKDPDQDALLYSLKIFALYKQPEGVERIALASKKQLAPDGYMWSVIFDAFDKSHPSRHYILDQLRDPLPVGFASIAYLDFANRIARENKIDRHPFDSAKGKLLLRRWIAKSPPAEFSYAVSATASLPWISNPERDKLLKLAQKHPDQKVRLEAAWASAKIGDRKGIDQLVAMCLDPRFSELATIYLKELGRKDVIPKQARTGDFKAMAEMCSWLAYPTEYGAPPDEIELYDTRRIYWPPTKDTRRVWLFKYCYKAGEARTKEDVGIGMVGSITFALFGEVTAKMSPEDVYSLHCCWELQMRHDKRAPKKRNVKEGRKLLKLN